MTLPDLEKQHHDALVQEGRKKYVAHLEDVVLDYLHNSAMSIEAFLTICVKVFGNVVNNPDEEKYRKASVLYIMLAFVRWHWVAEMMCRLLALALAGA